MKKMYIFLFIFLLSLSMYSQGQEVFSSIYGITPKEYFSSGKISYYFGYDGAKSIKIDNDSLLIYDYINFSKQGYGNVSLSRLLQQTEELFYSSDNSLVIYKTVGDYSCKNNPASNCLYSPVYIRKINKKSLTGNISLHRIDKSIPIEEKNIINFPFGSELYSIVVEVPYYDFYNFTDMESLVCSKNEENLCKGVINNGIIDKIALFELSSIKKENIEFLFKDTDNGLVYNYNLLDNQLIPYNKACFQSVDNIKDLQGCIENNILKGTIKQHKHPTGIIYWEIDYKNPSIDNIFFWVNNRGEPFKVYTNGRLICNFSLFNNQAAEVIKKFFIKNYDN